LAPFILVSFKTKCKQIPKEVKLFEQEARFGEIKQKMKKKAEDILPRWTCIMPRWKEITLKQICKILGEDLKSLPHDEEHRATMHGCETSCHDVYTLYYDSV
jgi:hypothetical protein